MKAGGMKLKAVMKTYGMKLKAVMKTYVHVHMVSPKRGGEKEKFIQKRLQVENLPPAQLIYEGDWPSQNIPTRRGGGKVPPPEKPRENTRKGHK